MRTLFGDDFSVLHSLLRTIQGFTKSCLLDWLQQIVNRVHFERADGVFVVGRDERDERHRLPLQHSDDANSIDLRHLPVQQRQIGLLPLDKCHRFLS